MKNNSTANIIWAIIAISFVFVAVFVLIGFKVIDANASDNISNKTEVSDINEPDIVLPSEEIVSGNTDRPDTNEPNVVLPSDEETASGNTTVLQEECSSDENDIPAEYDDRTYEEELEEEQQTGNNTQYYASRLESDKEEAGNTASSSDEVSPDDIPFLRISNLSDFYEINSDTVGWLYIDGSEEEAVGTPIDAPIVQTTDNSFYLSHTFGKQENVNGWIFADYKCCMEDITKNYNTVLYGHARSYKMFGGLKALNEMEAWYTNKYNHFIQISSDTEMTVWQIFSWYETTMYDDYTTIDFSSPDDFVKFAYNLQSKNQMTGIFKTFDFDENDRILTLSTCKGRDPSVRVAVHAKLVKRKVIE